MTATTALRLALLIALLPATLQAQAWKSSTPEQQGLNASPLTTLAQRIRSGDFGAVDRMVVIRNRSLVMNERFRNNYVELSRGKASALGCGSDACKGDAELHDYNYLHPDFHPWYKGRDVHTLQSVTKSVTATLFGVALQRGQLKSLNTPLLSYFGAYDVSKADPRLKKATLVDLLTMRSGIEWHEVDRPLDTTNTTLQLEHSRDWIRFTLSQPMDAEPGTKFAYNSGGSQLMSEIIRSVSGEHVDRYAEKHLFEPLGITNHHWKKTPTGHPDTEGGLYLETLDLAKIGQLYLDDGVWNGRRILPAGWAREATKRHVERISENPNAPGYGYQWWRYDRRGVEVWAGNGFGGQFLVVLPAQGIVGVIQSWNVFGNQVPGILGPFIDALINATATQP